ncbi:unnamed protein product [Tuber aestivum]|uniref:Uncharacterized protein n=1 Tax=Tuber aestivum TaxID=59557 RepID=A0A292PNU8_9PEZI|nr:unnamed protein product [Tuber aestivum]
MGSYVGIWGALEHGVLVVVSARGRVSDRDKLIAQCHVVVCVICGNGLCSYALPLLEYARVAKQNNWYWVQCYRWDNEARREAERCDHYVRILPTTMVFIRVVSPIILGSFVPKVLH